MNKIGIIICSRYQSCGGGKCLRALKERKGAFAKYSPEEDVELVGYSNCGGCPGGNIEYVPEEMIKNGADTIHFATGFVVGYPPCPYWEKMNMTEFAADLFHDDASTMRSYD
jgi:predicted metal-binding protein